MCTNNSNSKKKKKLWPQLASYHLSVYKYQMVRKKKSQIFLLKMKDQNMVLKYLTYIRVHSYILLIKDHNSPRTFIFCGFYA